MLRLLACERVSMAPQGASGLGLETQCEVISNFAASRGSEVLTWFTVMESICKVERPELQKGSNIPKTLVPRWLLRSSTAYRRMSLSCGLCVTAICRL